MKFVIEIDEEDYKECKFRKDLLSLGGEPDDLTFNMRIETVIGNGISLEEEFEKIKAEIEEIKLLRDNPYNNETEYSVSMEELRKLFDKHIAELNGD